MILILDGNNIAYRAFHTAQGDLTAKFKNDEGGFDQVPSGVILGTINMIKGYLEKFPEADKVICVFDGGKAKWRLDLYPDYKSNRNYGKDDPVEKARFDGLFSQINTLHEFLPKLGISSIKIKKHEADDIIGGLCRKLGDLPKTIITSDKDMFQLINNSTYVYSLYKEIVISPLNFYEVNGVTLEAYLGYRAMLGDSSDNIQGVPGIGEKTAKSLMNTYGHIDNVLNARGEDRKKLEKSARTRVLFDPKVQQILGINNKIMNLKYADLQEAEADMHRAIHEQIVVDSTEVKDFLIKWQFASILANFMPWILPFKMLSHLN